MRSVQRDMEQVFRLAMATPLSIPLSVGEPIYEYASVWRSRDRWAITYGAAPGWSVFETRRALKAKLKKAWADDQRSEPEHSGLAGRTLSKRTGASSVGTGNSAEGPYDPGTLLTNYMLVLANTDGPAGFCAFTVQIQYVGHGAEITFEVEILDAFIEPLFRDRGHSHGFCVAIAQFAINAINELNDRLITVGARFAEDTALQVVGDVESLSGERFLLSVKRELEARADAHWWDEMSPFQMRPGVSISSIEVDARW
ncbi:hypothetical protein A6P55_07715 [Pandoraea pnomenusa]|nr:hypothetical protein A6P55_07715 [Pandoraea pnomenusa]